MSKHDKQCWIWVFRFISIPVSCFPGGKLLCTEVTCMFKTYHAKIILRNIFVFSKISQHWAGAGRRNPFLWRTKTCVAYISITMDADDLETRSQGTCSHGFPGILQHQNGQHIEAETRWPPFSRQHFQMHFLQWKYMNFNQNFTEVCS